MTKFSIRASLIWRFRTRAGW